MTISTKDLLYAHGCLCHYARRMQYEEHERGDAERLRDVINSFQLELKLQLIPNVKPFVVLDDGIDGWSVEPIGGWQ